MPTHSSFIPFIPRSEDDPARRISAIDPKLSRSNYFDGKLLRASDLIRDQLYLDERLREAGRALGPGIVRGFEVSLTLAGQLTVTPGLAIAPSGRVLEHEGPAPLTVNLFDTASFAALNPDETPRLERGLYAVVARLASRSEGAAEVFPADLAGERGFHANAFTEGVELVLTDLRARLPGLSRRDGGGGAFTIRGIADRAALAREFLANSGQPAELDEDAVALALLAVEDGGPLWLDHALVRRPQRAPGTPGAGQADLMAHHDELLAAILADRAAAGRSGAFAASDYFDRLPPAGRMPVAAADPAGGNQRFFPPHMSVSIAPVRDTDLPAVVAEAALLDPIELNERDPADVMILVPLADGTFDTLARRIELDPTERTSREGAFRTALEALEDDAGTIGEARLRLEEYERLAIARTPLEPNRLPSINPVVLRARGTPPALDADVAAWRAIRAEASRTGEMWFVRRAPRAAATEVSAVVAARGVALPPLSDAPPSEVARLRAELAAAVRARDAALAEIRELRAVIEALREEISDTAGGDAAEIAELRRQLAVAEERNAELRRRIRQLEEALEDGRRFERELAAARAEIERLRAEIGDTSGEDRLRAEINRLEAVVAAANRRTEEAERTAERLRIDPERLIVMRRIADENAARAARRLIDNVSPEEMALIQRAALVAPASTDAALWPTLQEARQRGVLREFVGVLEETLASNADASTVARNARNLGISDTNLRLWTPTRTDVPGGGVLREPGGGLIRGGTDQPIGRLLDANAPRRVELAAIRTVRQLAASRNFRDLQLVRRIQQAVGNDRALLAAVNLAVAASDPVYDVALWPTLERVIERDRLSQFAEFLREQAGLGLPLGLAVAAQSTRFQLTAALRDAWSQVDFDIAGGGQ